MGALAEPVETDFAAYVASSRPALLRAARAITGDPHLAEDLLQATLVRVGLRWAAIREPGAVDAYVRRALTNQSRSWHRQPWRTREQVSADLPEPDARWDPAPVPPRVDPRRLWELVTGLPPRQRAAVVLRHYEGLSEAETAAVLGCAPGTVKSNTSRGLAALRRRVLAELAADDLDLAG